MPWDCRGRISGLGVDRMNSGNKDFLGGMFDFNGDGKTDLCETFIAYKIYEAVMRSFETDEGDDKVECRDE